MNIQIPARRKQPMKHRKPRTFGVLIVPEKDSHIRRFSVSYRSLLAALVVTAVTGVAIFACIISLGHYYNAYSSTKTARIRAARFERERAELTARVGELEDTLKRTQRFAAKLETVVKDHADGETSLGPLEGSLRSIKDALKGDDGNADVLWTPPTSNQTTEDVLKSVDLMKDNAEEIESLLHAVFAEQQDRLYFWSSVPTMWPTRGFLTSQFGASRGHRMHEGLDIASRVGTPIVASGSGIVTFVGYKGGYGYTFKIDHGYGIQTVHAHCSKIFVQEGDRVKRGQLLAQVGNTGSSTGPHLHYEIRVDGVPVNPMRYLARR
jgi:hypothetical protein